MFTASHNPAQYNGIKLCRAGARPVGQDTGLAEIRDLAAARRARRTTAPARAPVDRSATCSPTTPRYLRALVDLRGIRPLKVVVDAGNGMGGLTVPAVLARACRVDLVPLYFELDGTFPNHEANPLDPANLRRPAGRGASSTAPTSGSPSTATPTAASSSTSAASRSRPSAVTALVAARELAKHPGATVIHNLITSRAVPEIVREHGGTPVRTRVGHSFIKAEMAAHRRGLRRRALGALLLPRLLARRHRHARRAARARRAGRAGRGRCRSWPRDYERYVASGEINSTVADQAAADRRRPGGLRRPAGRRRRRARRAHRDRRRRLVVQPAGRPTPSRCCGSTPRPPTERRWRGCATRCWRSSGRQASADPR